MSSNQLWDGVVAFSIEEGMPLTDPWIYQPNSNGPVITTKQGYLEISRDPKAAANQWTMLSIQVSKPVEGGAILQFDISYVAIQVLISSVLVQRYAIDSSLLPAPY
jgi:hypothetical protein